MTWKRVSVWLFAAIMTCAVCTTTADAAVVDKTAPYEGEYFIAYNDHISYPGALDSGVMPSIQLDEAANESEQYSTSDNVIAIRENMAGETIYQIEPRNLEERIAPPVISSRRRAPARKRTSPPQVGDEREFVTMDTRSEATAYTPFILKYSGEHCNIWLEKNDAWDITDEMITELGMEYDVKAHNRMMSAFGSFYDRDEDGKLGVLLYDIQDGYDGDTIRSYVGGFFMPADLIGSEFNNMDVIHIDTYPSIVDVRGEKELSSAKSTMVHELQHLIEQSYCVEQRCSGLPTWINEGMSLAAEHMVYGRLDRRITYYNNSISADKPVALAAWNDDDPLPNYAYSYLFFQYLRTQTKDFTGGGEELYKYIIQSPNRSARCVEQGMRQFFPYISMNDIFLSFHIALTLNEPTGLYGFAGEPEFSDVQAKLYTGKASLKLNNGAAVVKKMSSKSYTPDEKEVSNIRFAAFSRGGSSVDAPRANVSSGLVYQFKNITLSCAERNATMYYTVDGSEPTAETGLVYNGRPIPLLSNTILKAVTVTSDGQKSQVVQYVYTIVPEDVELYRFLVGDYDGYGPDSKGVIQAPDGGLIQIGTFHNNDAGGDEFYDVEMAPSAFIYAYIAKYDPNGMLEWIRSFGEPYQTYAFDIVPLEDGFAITGNSFRRKDDSHSGDFEGIPEEAGEADLPGGWKSYAYIAKFDWNGNRQWINGIPCYYRPELGRPDSSKTTIKLTALSSCPEGGLVATGAIDFEESGVTSGNAFRGSDGIPLIAKVDAQGNFLWKRELDLPEGCGDFFAVTVLEDETIVAAGYATQKALGKGDLGLCTSEAQSPSNLEVPILVAFDQDGSILWEEAFEDSETYFHYFYDLVPLEAGFAVSGTCNSVDGSGYVFRFAADSSGCELLWQWAWPRTGNMLLEPSEDGLMVAATLQPCSQASGNEELIESVGGIITQGYDDDEGIAGDIFVIKLDLETGKRVWAENYATNYVSAATDHWTNPAHGSDMISLGNRKYAITGGNSWIYSKHQNEKVIGNHALLFTFYDESIPYYKVSGNVGLPGVSIGGKLSDSQGNYIVKVMEGESITLTPTLEGYTFAPASRKIGPVTKAVTGIDFTPAETKYTVSGTVVDPDGVPLAGVTVAQGVVTGTDGKYSFQARPGANVALTPALAGMTFEPASRTITGLSKDIPGQDFRVPRPKFEVSGTVTRNGVGQGGVQVCPGVITNVDGSYTITAEKGQDVTLTPSFFRYVFTPAEATLTDISGDMIQDFAMELGPALLVVSPTGKDFGRAYPGYEPVTPQTVRITNAGGKPCSGLTVTVSGSSFDVTGPEATTLDAGASTTFTVVPKSGLGIGVYAETVTVSGGGRSETVEVTFAVEKVPTPAALEIDPTEWDFGAVQEWYAPIDRVSITVRNLGETPCEELAVQLQEGSAFLVPRRLSGTLAGGGEDTFLLRPRDNLAQGEYEETVTVTNGEVSAQMRIKFVVTKGPDTARLVFEPAELDFGKRMEGYDPLEPVTVKIKNVGGLPCSRVTVSLSEKKSYEKGPFELISDFSHFVSLHSGEYFTFTVKPRDDLMAPDRYDICVVDGVYEDTITVTSQDISTTMKVRFKVTPFHEPTQLKTDPDPVDFGKACLGYESIEEKYVMVYNVGEHYCANATASLKDGTAFEITGQELRYLDPDPNYGNRGSVALKPKDGLGVGVYEDTIIIADDATYHEVSVKFEVGTATLDVDPASYEFPSAYEGVYWAYELETGISATNNGTLTCEYPSPYFENDNGFFQIVGQDTYNYLPGGVTDVIRVVPVEGLEVGTYEDTLVVEIYTPDYIWLTKSVPLKFTVLEPPAPAELKLEPEYIDFGPYQVGYDPVEPVTFTVTNIGGVDCPDPQFDYYPSYFDLELVGELDLSAGGVTTFRIKPKDGLGKINLSAGVSFWDEFDPYDSEDDLSAYLPISLTITEEPVLAPKLEVTPTSYTFESKKAEYEAVTPVTFTVKNPGTAACTGLKGELQENSHFEFVKAVPDSVAAGGEGTFTLRPKAGLAPGTYTETVTVTNSTLKKELTVTFAVTEKPEEPGPTPTAKLEVTPESYTFEGKEEGYEAVTPVTFTVKNPGTAACTGLKGELQASSKFEFVKAVPTSLDAGASETFTLRPKTGLTPGTYTEKVTVTNGTLKKELTVTFVVTEKPGETESGGEDKPDKPGGEDKPDKPDKPGGEDKPDKPGEEDKPDTPSGGEDKPTPRPPAGSSSDGDGDGGNGQPPAKTEEKPVVYEEHLPYITGFKDGTFRSEASLTRGQCAAILSRLSDDFDPQKTYGNHFPDVAENSWYINYVGYLTEKNVIRGYPDGTFRPDEPITRAEFVALLGQGLGLEKVTENPYPDCGRHWASGSIARLTEEGVLNGYPDGSFRPDIPISRSEAVKAVNKAYHRSAEEGKLKVASPFTDVDISNWAYYEILEAAIEHRVEK